MDAAIKELDQQSSKHQSAAEFVDKLDQMHRSKGYIFIRDNMTKNMLAEIRSNPELRQKFQAIKAECKQSWDYDHKTATMMDVNRACTNLYGMILKLLQAETSSFDPVLNAMGAAINTIEERLGMPKTQWTKEEGHEDVDAGDAGNVSGITSGGE